jgi:glycosyltransferase involved in cell wall biosynthesis
MENRDETTLPKISIVTAVYNNAPYIENCIKSVLSQDYPHLEYLIIDGGSTDGTVQIIEKYANRLACFISEKDRGQTHALNKGFARASGDIFAWLNADEQYLPGTLHDVGRAFSIHFGLDFYYGNRIVVNNDLIEIGRRKWVPMHPRWHLLYIKHTLPTDASFWSARIHRETGELDEKHFPKFGMDFDWLLRLSFMIKKWKYTQNYLSVYMERFDRASKIGKNSNPNLVAENRNLALKLLLEYHSYSKTPIMLGRMIAAIWTTLYVSLGMRKIGLYIHRFSKISSPNLFDSL